MTVKSGISVSGISLGAFNFTVAGSSASVGITGAISGSGQLRGTTGARLSMHSTNTTASSYTGSLNIDDSTLTSSIISSGSQTYFGSRPITIGATSRIIYNVDPAVTSFTIPNPITVTGTAGSTNDYSLGTSRIGITYGSTAENNDVVGILGGFPGRFSYGIVSGKSVTFSGAVALSSDLTVYTDAQTTFSGALTGPTYTISRNNGNSSSSETGGTIVVAGSTNTTATANATYTQALRTTTITTACDGFGLAPVLVGRLNKVIINGTCQNVLVRYGGILGGSGTVGNVTVQSSTVETGNSPGILKTGNISFDSTATLNAEIGGTAAGEFDQLNVTGTVSLGSATFNLSHYNSYTPALSSTYVIINNDGSDAVTGIFSGLVEGARIYIGSYTYRISYVGGTGNDVVLSVSGTPGAPDTSGVLAEPVNIGIAAAVVVAGVGVLLLRHKYLKTVRKTTHARK